MSHHTVYRGSTAISHFMNDLILYTDSYYNGSHDVKSSLLLSIKWNCMHTTFEGEELSTS